MPNKRILLASVLVVCLVAFFMVSGCGKRKESDLTLPEQEARQLKAVEEGAKPTGGVVGKAATAPGAEFKKFYVYADQGYFKNHYIPAGWMGDYGDIKFADAWSKGPYSRKSCIRIVYTAEKKQGAGWAGIYWQDPANNWGNLKGGYDLTGAKKLTFWAKGEKGGEVITEFKVGGIRGEISDTAAVSIGPVTLTPEWAEYTIDLKDEDLSLIIGGFSFVISTMENPEGATFYIDEIAFE